MNNIICWECMSSNKPILISKFIDHDKGMFMVHYCEDCEVWRDEIKDSIVR